MLTGNICKLSNGVTFDALDSDFKLRASLSVTAGLYCTLYNVASNPMFLSLGF